MLFSITAAGVALLTMQAASGQLAPVVPGLPASPAPMEPQPAPVPQTPPSNSALVNVDTADSAARINGIRFIGVKAPAEVAAAARRFIGQRADRKTLRQLADAISAAYARTDIAFYTVAIPRQDLSSGEVKIQLAEGHVSAVAFPKGASPLLHAYARRLTAENPLHRSTVERYLSLMRDIPGAKMGVGLGRGLGLGGVKMILTPSRKKTRFALGYDNQGPRNLGRGQFDGSAKFYSLLRDGDATSIALAASTDFDRYRQVSASHSTPLGSDGLTLGLFGAWVDTRLKAPPVKGKAWAAGLSLAYPVIRSYRTNLTVSGGIDGLDSDAALLGAVLSSDHIRAARGSVVFSKAGKKAALAVSMQVSRGLAILSARATPGISAKTFTKVSGTLSYNRVFGKHVITRLALAGQYGTGLLPANERFIVGGAQYARAFDSSFLSGDNGAGGSLELAYRPDLGKRFKDSEAYVYVDGAVLHEQARLTLPALDYGLASAGGGVRLSVQPHAILALEAAHVIDDPYPRIGGGWRFNLSYRLHMRP